MGIAETALEADVGEHKAAAEATTTPSTQFLAQTSYIDSTSAVVLMGIQVSEANTQISRLQILEFQD